MRIALVDPSLYTPPYDGALASALARRGHEVTLVGRSPRATDPPLGDGVRLEPLFYSRSERRRARRGPESRPGALADACRAVEHVDGLRRLVRFVAREGVDVVHWQWPSLPWIDASAIAWLRHRAPQIITVHDSRVFKAQSGVRRAMQVGWRRYLRAADRIVVHLPATRDAVCRAGVPDDRIRLVPHPPLPAGRPGTPEPLAVDRVHVVFFGRLSFDKGIDVLAAAVDLLPYHVRDRLCVHVRGPPVPRDPRVGRALARLHSQACVRVRAGFVPEDQLDALLAAADAVVLPHREVDASGMLMRALAHDVALVAADLRCFRDALGDSSAVAWFRAADADALAAELTALVADGRRIATLRRGVGALRARMPSWPDAAELTERVYREAGARHPGVTVADGV